MKLAALTALAFAMLQDPPPEKVALMLQPKQGDKLTLSQQSELSANGVIKMQSMEHDMKFTIRGVQKRTVELAEVQEGRVTKAVFEFKEDSSTIQRDEMGPATSFGPLNDKKLTALLKDGKVQLESSERIDVEVAELIKTEDQLARAFPKDPVAVGDNWDVTGDAAKAAIKSLVGPGATTTAKMNLKLAAVQDVAGRRCAILSAQLDYTGLMRQQMNMEISLKMEAQLTVWIERGYILEVKAKGKCDLKGKMGGESTLDGKGEYKLERTIAVP